MTEEYALPQDDASGLPYPVGEASGDETAADEQAAPTFLLLLDDEQWRAELPLLIAWVHVILVPFYISEPSPGRPWCPQWWQHNEALAWLHALWMAWQEHTDPAAGGWSGPGIWHRDFLIPALNTLRDPEGPFAGCTTDPSRPNHRPTRPTPVDHDYMEAN
ncbi:DUF4913 domain-containing protein [Microbispora sp. NBRC 16548]|uniref:DUF4913 domain-containing protein n=1 Tax=Microbispora sp. NBRC 16548 TaxID=3030994 RepID=UPI0024A04C1D|nr:DUF4913 domain-containing protein [Microbispora sp. NBRC 16548]GLX06778.1 hypothetical protein Misp03_37050 [Microbispora sp. NBRC 16548]